MEFVNMDKLGVLQGPQLSSVVCEIQVRQTIEWK